MRLYKRKGSALDPYLRGRGKKPLARKNRKLLGMEIAATRQIEKKLFGYVVPAEKGKPHKVNTMNKPWTCSCLDFETRNKPCKHIFAVEYHIQKETGTDQFEYVDPEDEESQLRLEPFSEYSKKITYKQNWPKYNAAQTNEKALFLFLLADLCKGLHEPVQNFGRPRIPMADRIFSVAYKVYSKFSGRRFSTDLRMAYESKYLSQLPHYNSMFKFMESEELTPILKMLVSQSSLPLKSIERDFAVDSTGLGTSRFTRWVSMQDGKERDKHDWIKIHLICGVKTHIVADVIITDRKDHDYPYLRPLVQAANVNFDLEEVLADKGYSGMENVKAVYDLGAQPYIMFKSSATGRGMPTAKGDGPELWSKLYHMYTYHRDDFLASYHKRSNVESTFSMIKAKFGNSLRTKKHAAHVNEALCKVLCHNLCVVIQSMYRFGIHPTLWSER